ncbi:MULTISPECIES: hypothetical protein [unclassified Shinella]|uniref:phage adaptor protein n=1 Tax=unclassified Shinella TaxID=2643062 RepID=UPI00225D4201|nr:MULTISPECIES: hypothetical protein [unclassified Shinella]MCO5140877.1 hypothetical protein [Shinella sp.]MDC7256432.1 hypothetical protein [Shinella sp. YE25]CAI0339298.1 conserved hypothetical protein [Rhizobiaceae bacterium]CAK7257708.1 conserved protein of unknown function [Shinella sp. WSC3-e]
MTITVVTGGPIGPGIDVSLTLGALKAEIADDLDRTDLTSQIATEIQRAIKFYQYKRFYFNEVRDEVFQTVAYQGLYNSLDAEIIQQFIEFDDIYLNGEQMPLTFMEPREWEVLASGGNGAKPRSRTYYNQAIGLYPLPDQAYTVRMTGHIIISAPSSDNETNNPWLTEAYDLIRARTVANLALKKLRDDTLFQRHSAVEASEFNKLAAMTASKVGSGFVTPTEF